MALQSLAVSLEGPRAVAHDGAEAETAEIVYGFLRSRGQLHRGRHVGDHEERDRRAASRAAPGAPAREPGRRAGPMRVADVVRRHAAARPHDAALVCGSERFSWKDLDERTDALAAVLAGMSEPGDRVAIVTANCHQHLEAVFAASKAALVSVPLNHRWKQPRAGRHPRRRGSGRGRARSGPARIGGPRADRHGGSRAGARLRWVPSGRHRLRRRARKRPPTSAGASRRLAPACDWLHQRHHGTAPRRGAVPAAGPGRRDVAGGPVHDRRRGLLPGLHAHVRVPGRVGSAGAGSGGGPQRVVRLRRRHRHRGRPRRGGHPCDPRPGDGRPDPGQPARPPEEGSARCAKCGWAALRRPRSRSPRSSA